MTARMSYAARALRHGGPPWANARSRTTGARTITRVDEDLGEDEDWLRDVANEMEIEDGVIWVCGVGEDGVQAFTDFGIAAISRGMPR